MKKQHGNTGKANARKGPVSRSDRLSLRVPPDLLAALDAAATTQSVSRSEAAIRALESALIKKRPAF